MSFFDRIHLEWWQALVMVLVMAMRPLFKAAAVILVAKLVKPEIAKVALPLMFSARGRREPKVGNQNAQNAKLPG